ncbi:MAG: hypothetical protein M0R77_02485 [Gammaproteobacteria bacterium]|nr:hypothetical protein [Gammaproteobacteria bacterium]
MKVSNLKNLKPAKLRPIWKVIDGEQIKLYKCMSGPNKGSIINNPQDYFKTDTMEIDDENA